MNQMASLVAYRHCLLKMLLNYLLEGEKYDDRSGLHRSGVPINVCRRD